MTTNLNDTGLNLRTFYKVPVRGGLELPFGGRWLKVIGHSAGSINFVTANGKHVYMGNATARLLAKNAADVRHTTPRGFL